MKRAAIIGSNAFPFIITYFLKTVRMWDEVVDKIYIAVDNYAIPETEEFFKKKVSENPKIVVFDRAGFSWPDCYKYAVEHSTEDVFLILHDDTYIYDKNVIDTYFSMAEKNLVVTPLHSIYSPADIIDNALEKKYPGKFPLVGEPGLRGYPYSFLLFFLFISRFNLDKTTKNFNCVGYKAGTYIDSLGITAPSDIGGDTGWNLGLELFHAGVDIYPIHEYETSILNFQTDAMETLKEWQQNKSNIFSENAGWVHIFNTGNCIPLWWKGVNEKSEGWTEALTQIKLAWFLDMLECDDYSEIPDIKEKGYDLFNIIVRLSHSNVDRIKEFRSIFHNLIFRKENV